MSVYSSLTDFLEDIADAIREKDETSAMIVANTYPTRIRALSDNRPKQVATEEEMAEYLVSSNIGKVYQYTGTSSLIYDPEALYVIEDSESEV